jgi:menaquinone-dependent protoporphyrinogen oxidase
MDNENAQARLAHSKVLIAYASKSGATGEVAEALGESLRSQGATVDVRAVKTVTSLDGYGAVVIGSSVRMGKWLSEATEFVTKNQAWLSQMPTALFTLHMLNLDDSAASVAGRRAYTAPVRQLVSPAAEAFFAGRMAYAHLSFFESLMSKAMKAQEQDLRDWAKIRAWAAELRPALGLT